MAADDATDLDLRGYMQTLLRRKWIVVAAMAVVFSAAMVASFLQTPIYEARAEMLLQPKTSENLFDSVQQRFQDPNRSRDTEIRVLSSEPVANAVRKKLGGSASVSASGIGQTDVIAVKATSTGPARAAAVANAYAEAYINFRRTQSVDDLLAASKQIQDKIGELQTQLKALPSPPAPPARLDDAISSQRDSLVQQIGVFKQKLDQLQVDASLKTGGAQLVTPAAIPTVPIKPTPMRTGMTALMLGGLFGIGLAFLLDYLDDSINTKEDLEAIAGEVPVLALVPDLATWKDESRPMVVSLMEPSSAAAEAYRSLRTAIQFMGLDRPTRTVQMTSASPNEGKTTTLANLGVALARAGNRVVIVCCDLRRPRIHEFFGLSNEKGFTSVILGDSSLSDVLQKVPGEERLFMLASGPPPPNPSELLSNSRTVGVLTALQAEADIVLIDCPPVLPVTDAAVLSNRVDATLLVATVGKTNRRDLHRAMELLRQVDAPIIGTVLNGVTADGSYGYTYQYTYKPRPKPGVEPTTKRRARAFRR